MPDAVFFAASRGKKKRRYAKSALLSSRMSLTVTRRLIPDIIAPPAEPPGPGITLYWTQLNLPSGQFSPGLDVSKGAWVSYPSDDESRLYPLVDEATPDDADYIKSSPDPVDDIAEVKYLSVVTPLSDQNQFVSYEFKGDEGTRVTFSLRCGATEIASWVFDPAPVQVTRRDERLTAAQVAAITNYQDLRLRLLADKVAPPSEIPVIHVGAITGLKTNKARGVFFRDQHMHGQPYMRFQNHVCFTKTAFNIRFETDAGYFKSPGYAMLVGNGTDAGVERARTTVSPTATYAYFTGNFGDEADGPYLFEIRCLDADGNYKDDDPLVEFGHPFWVWIDRNGTAKDHDYVVMQNGDFEWEFLDQRFLWLLVPKTMLKTRSVPITGWLDRIPSTDTPTNDQPGVLPARIFPGGEPFSNAQAKTNIVRRNLLPTAGPFLQERRPAKTSRGITVCENIQGYLKNHIIYSIPQQPILDGPRGVATAYSPVALWPGHAGGVYGMDAWSFWRIDQTGERVTFAGLRHTDVLYWEDMIVSSQFADPADATTIPGVEIVGDWDSSIPASKRFPWEAWGMFFDLRTVVPHNVAEQVYLPPYNYLPAHIGEGPVAFSSCRFGRILKYQFHKDRPNDKPTITEWVTGLNDPWGVAPDQDCSAGGVLTGTNVMFVAERKGHKITMWSMDTPNTPVTAAGVPTTLGNNVLISNPTGDTYGAIGSQSTRRFIWNSQHMTGSEPTLSGTNSVRAANIIAPEGLVVQDGYVYWGAMAQYAVKRINIATRAVEWVRTFFPGSNPSMSYVQSNYLEIRISDGSFGPRGTVFTSTWDNQYQGRCRAFIPSGGTDINGLALTHATQWDWSGMASAVPEGQGGFWTVDGYVCAMGMNNGILAVGTSGRHISTFEHVIGIDGPAVNQTSAKAGFDYYVQQGYYMLYGNCGFSYIDLPLPFGENADCDYWLTLSGHKVPVPPPAEIIPQWFADAGKPRNTWVAIPNTELSTETLTEIAPQISAGLCNSSGGMIGYGHPRRGIYDYSGATIKTSGSEMLVFGGGGGTDPTIEGSWAGNDVRGLRLEDDAPRWVTRIAPSNASAVWFRSPVSASLSDPTKAYMKDGRPNARHSYWAPQFTDSNNTFWSIGCRNTWERDESATGEMDKVDSVVLTAGAWSTNSAGMHPDFPSVSDADDTWCVKNASEEFFVALRNGTIAKFSAASNTWSIPAINGIPAQVEGAFSLGRAYCVYDSTRNRIYRIGNNTLEGADQFAMIDLTSNTWIPATSVIGNDATAILGGLGVLGRFGFCYDAGRDCAILFKDDGHLYTITCLEDDSWWVDHLILNGTPPVSGGSTIHGGALAHVWSRMQYVPNLKGVCILQAYNKPAYFVKTS